MIDSGYAGPPALFSSNLKSNPLISVVDEVVRIQSRFSSLFAEVRALSGLNRLENTVLTAVLEARTPPTVPQIGRSLGHPRQVIQRAVNELEARDLVEKKANPDHKRVPLLTGTEKAYQSKRVTDRMAIAVADEFFRQFDAEACRQIAGDLHGLRLALEAFSRRKSDLLSQVGEEGEVNIGQEEDL